MIDEASQKLFAHKIISVEQLAAKIGPTVDVLVNAAGIVRRK